MTLREVRSAWRWFQKCMGLQDWALEKFSSSARVPRWVEDGDSPEKDFGQALMVRREKSFDVWINPEVSTNQLQTFFHECVHVLFEDLGIETGDPDGPIDGAVDRMASVCEIAYKNRKK